MSADKAGRGRKGLRTPQTHPRNASRAKSEATAKAALPKEDGESAAYDMSIIQGSGL